MWNLCLRRSVSVLLALPDVMKGTIASPECVRARHVVSSRSAICVNRSLEDILDCYAL